MTPFIPLRVHSAYSLLEGAIGLKDLTKWCSKHRVPAVAVTDSGNLFGSLEFAQAAAGTGIQPIMGCVLRMKPPEEGGPKHGQGAPHLLPLYAQNDIGWQNLMALVSEGFLRPAGTHAPLLAYDALEGKTDGLIALSGAENGTLAAHLLAGQTAKAEAFLAQMQRWFPKRVYIEIARHGLPEQQRIEPALLQMAMEHHLPLVATNDAYFIHDDMFEAHDAFLCIAEGSTVSQEERRRLTPEHRLKTPDEMAALFADVPEALENTVQLARRCTFMAPSRKPILPTFDDAPALLRDHARAGLEERLKHVPEAQHAPYRERLEFELDTIINMQFPGYFLIVSDFIRWAKAQGIPVGPGRGSGAGSVAAWALSITDLDPLRYGLLFERFLNPERVSMPDFDVDFCQERRDEVIAYVQERYGKDRVAQIITFGKLQARAVLRDVGRVLELPYGQVDRICKMVPNNPASPITLEDALEVEPMLKAAMREDEAVQRLVETSLKLEGLNRHASTHAAGVVIADRPLSELVPMYRDPKSDMPVVQYSMKYAEGAGLVKFDFLGLKTLTVLKRAVDLVARKGVALDLLHLPEGDAKTYAMLGRGETVGVFQLESAGMRDTLKKMKPDCIEDLIALVSLYRPGPMDNIPTYIARKHGQEKPDFLHPLLEPILRETFGVIIYQEQVMQIAQVLAGYSLGEADLLRRAMGKKIRSEMEAQREIFVEKAVARGVEKKQAASIFDLIAKFAEYGFNKSHAAAYALIAYQTAYVKAHFPVEFFAASMTYDMHNTDKLGVFREEAARFGIKLLPPDVNQSGVDFEVEGEHIRYALAAIRNVGAAAMHAVVETRQNGPFAQVFDFAERLPAHALNKRGLEFLIKAGAFDTLHTARAPLIAALDLVCAHAERVHQDKATSQANLFAAPGVAESNSPPLPKIPEWTSLERLHHEFEAIGFYLTAHPLEAYARVLTRAGVVPYAQLPARLSEKYGPVKIAGIITGRKTRVSEKGRFAFLQMSDTSGVFECSVFDADLLTRHHALLEAGQMVIVQADGKMDESGPRLIAKSIASLEAEARRQPAAAASNVLIRILGPEAVAGIRGVLGEAGKNGAQVTLATPLPTGQTAKLRLPGRYALTPPTLEQLRTVAGVAALEEA